MAELAERHGEPVVLVGWSLGGLFAREIAKRRPERVAKVVTMGSPFSRLAACQQRLARLPAGHRPPVDEPPVEVELAAKPPVETVALWSPRDGIVHPRARLRPAGRARPRGGAALHPHRLRQLAPRRSPRCCASSTADDQRT